MVQGFSGFGFPKAHGAAFGLLAYQSTWLRVHYGEEFLCALLNEQPMGFYPPDALVHEAQRRGFEVMAPDVNASRVECQIEQGDGFRVRIGLGYVRGVKERDATALVQARAAGGPFRNLSDLASRAGAGAPALELLGWSGACDSLVEESPLVSARRMALWQLGVSSPGRTVPGGVQLSLPLDLPAPPKLRELSRWDSMLADYATIGLTVDTHPMRLLRSRLPAGTADSGDLERLQHGARIRIGGLVVARQRPGTASGVVFVLLEDELGTINLIIPPKIYERHRLLVRTEPLLLVSGKLERFAAAGGAINVLVDHVASIDAPDRLLAEIKDFSMLDDQVRLGLAAEKEAAAAAAEPAVAVAAGQDFRAVAPPVMSFGSGRRR
jgi:error-prone DNA polymerase